MILPVPRGRIRFLDFSQHGKLFDRLSDAFPEMIEPAPRGLGNKLRVESVGNYFVSLAPRLEDLNRVNASSFRVSPGIASILSANYAEGFSFVVCRFKSNTVEPHPIAYEHERLPSGAMFVPTRHAHGSKSVDVEHADWDHDIYTTCASAASFSTGAACEKGAGLTPKEKLEKLEAQVSQGEFGDIRKAAKSCWAAVLETGLPNLVDLLPCDEFLRHLRVDNASGQRAPNEDLLYTLSEVFAGEVCPPATEVQRDEDVVREVEQWLGRTSKTCSVL